jgi:hypothetical protein
MGVLAVGHASDGRIEISQAAVITDPGAYIVTANITTSNETPLKVTGSDIDVDLNGMVLKRTDSGTGVRAVLYVDESQNVKLHGGTLSGLGNQSIRIDDSQHVLVEDISFRAAGTGLFAFKSTHLQFRDLRINNDLTSSHALGMSWCTNITITSCIIEPRDFTSASRGIYLSSSKNIRISDCSISDLNIGLYALNTSSIVNINRCNFTLTGGASADPAIFLQGDRAQVVNCDILDGRKGIVVYGNDCMISGNRIVNNALAALTFASSANDNAYGNNIIFHNGSSVDDSGTNTIDFGGNQIFANP